MKVDFIKGVIVPILTPIDKNEAIDEMVLRRMINYVIKGGVHGILAYGSNGEFYAVEEEEMERGLKIMIDEAKGRVPIYMGIGAITTSKAIRIAKNATESGIAGISILQPMFIKPTEEEMFDHFLAIAKSVPNTPVLLYNNPGRTGYNIPVNLVLRLKDRCKNIVGIKDSSGDMTMTAELIRQTRGTQFKVLGGKDTLIYSALVHGASGCVATTANIFPELVSSIYNKYISGDISGALDAQYVLSPIRLAMDNASFPVGTKDLANLMNLSVGKPYLPNKASKDMVLKIMKDKINEAGLLSRDKSYSL